MHSDLRKAGIHRSHGAIEVGAEDGAVALCSQLGGSNGGLAQLAKTNQRDNDDEDPEQAGEGQDAPTQVNIRRCGWWFLMNWRSLHGSLLALLRSRLV